MNDTAIRRALVTGGSGDIGEQPGIGVQIYPVTIQSFCRQIAQVLQITR